MRRAGRAADIARYGAMGMSVIDLNADLGEDPDAVSRDIALMAYISSCNIACGGHAGDSGSMAQMVTAAQAAKIAIGAHPSYPDRTNFGRVTLAINVPVLIDALVAQIASLQAIAAQLGSHLHHIKPHGALYNDMADDIALSTDIVHALGMAFPDLAIMGLSGGACQSAASQAGMGFIAEGFIDRAYADNARLVPRAQPGAVLINDPDRLAQALSIAQTQMVTTNSGKSIKMAAQSLCIHSDSQGALETAKKVRESLLANGLKMQPAKGQ